MLSFDIRSLDVRAAVVDGLLPADDPIWQEGDSLPSGAIHVTGRISAAGQEQRFYWHGRIAGKRVLPCRRCLVDATVEVNEEYHLIYAAAGDADIDDPDVYTFGSRDKELDLRLAVRELWLLNAPEFVLCREDCKGLCPTCGTDLNAGPCACPPVHDARWDALYKLQPTSDK
jgi:uncharacterized protein